MPTQHSALTGADVHEPKGVDAASIGTLYVADGAGSGSWVVLDFSDISVAAPSTASDTGTAGQVASDADYIYICTATDTWKRVAISTW
jgi:hypothetical protein